MSKIDNESLERWKDAFAKDGIIYDSDEEYCEAIGNLTGFVDILMKIDKNAKRSSNKDKNGTGEIYVFDKDGNKVIL